jgi:hypothetical protein
MVNPAIFEHLQAKIDEELNVREELRNILQVLEKQGRSSFPLCGLSQLRHDRKIFSLNPLASAFYTLDPPYALYFAGMVHPLKESSSLHHCRRREVHRHADGDNFESRRGGIKISVLQVQ